MNPEDIELAEEFAERIADRFFQRGLFNVGPEDIEPPKVRAYIIEPGKPLPEREPSEPPSQKIIDGEKQYAKFKKLATEKFREMLDALESSLKSERE